MAAEKTSDPLYLWFAGLVEESFQTQLGMAEPALLCYLASLLTEFIHVERINQLCDGSGRAVDEVADMIGQAVTRTPELPREKKRTMHRHIGDFTLFWTGVYPENLKRLQRRESKDSLLSYFEQGKQSYAIASDLSNDATEPTAQILRALSEKFEFCVYGLGLVRKSWESQPRRNTGLTIPT